MKPSSSPCNACLDPKLSIISVLCRICYDNDKDEALIAPCHCKGTVAFVHRSCLERWLAESNTTMCELCHVVFRTERSPKYTSQQSIWRWLRSHRSPGGIGRGVRSDIIACTVITPVAIIITYVCLFSSDYYNQKKFIMVPAARWTSVSLLIMIGIMLIGYYLWVYSVIRLHSRMWYNWWQRECVVRYIPPSTAHICCHSPLETANPNNTPTEDNEDARSRNDSEVEQNNEEVEQGGSEPTVVIEMPEDENKETTV
ncbi:E3 ubiquitin-protein ligase MARCHF2 [Tribolium castaneum]|uniref:E3 ubiquitin-protein ligase MARCH3-like Protein n=1 Tax=Tribolium castaneum TaxID=7070 RepID=D6X1K6_TRICA|nr:PREDICTED: E3 ubiquitin-protein ligase MARCH2 [Tribolium castaneum]EFA09347.1 E3 ubiquitin-protein ligase MARCH3-like Protein [Tribolium castaneum]|eukprot:XP_008198594.1 PREDICTED: E3 ubiquitin-protein ligase MARCH2 [Tribolium castaneum]